MKEEKGRDGLCPVLDLAPQLDDDNVVVAEIFRQAERGATHVQRESERRTFLYIKPADVYALQCIHDIPVDDRPAVLRRVLVLEDIANEQRPLWPKEKVKK